MLLNVEEMIPEFIDFTLEHGRPTEKYKGVNTEVPIIYGQ